MSTEDTLKSPRGADLMLSYNKLMSLETGVLEVKAMLQAALALKGEVDRVRDEMKDHDIRLVALEQIQAIVIAKKSVWSDFRTFAYGAVAALGSLIIAIIAGGYIGIVPKLWGG